MAGCRPPLGFTASFFGIRFQRNRRQRKKPAPLNSPGPANIPPAPARGPLRSASSLAARGERYAFSLTTLGEGSRNRCDSGKDRPGRRPGRPQVRCGTICPRSAHAGPRRQILPSGSLPSGSRPDRLTQPRCSERFGSIELRRRRIKSAQHYGYQPFDSDSDQETRTSFRNDDLCTPAKSVVGRTGSYGGDLRTGGPSGTTAHAHRAFQLPKDGRFVSGSYRDPQTECFGQALCGYETSPPHFLAVGLYHLLRSRPGGLAVFLS